MEIPAAGIDKIENFQMNGMSSGFGSRKGPFYGEGSAAQEVGNHVMVGFDPSGAFIAEVRPFRLGRLRPNF